MTKEYSKGNRSAQRYRARIRKGNDMTIYAPWGKPLYDGGGGRPSFPPEGWYYFDNQFGRGFNSPEHIGTPYDKESIEDLMGTKIPMRYRRLTIVTKVGGNKIEHGKKGTLP